MQIRKYRETDLPQMTAIWNDVVEEGIAFPQEECLTEKTGRDFFASQSYTGVAETDGGIVGLYILHPNNIGRCGYICNASYAVSSACRGQHIGEKLVLDCLETAKNLGFRVLQFNAVVESNIHARHLYERLGFVQLGTIPGGFRMKDGPGIMRTSACIITCCNGAGNRKWSRAGFYRRKYESDSAS